MVVFGSCVSVSDFLVRLCLGCPRECEAKIASCLYQHENSMSLRLGDSAVRSARQWFSIAVLPCLSLTVSVRDSRASDCHCFQHVFCPRLRHRFCCSPSSLGGRAPDLHLQDLSKSSASMVERCTRFLFRTLSRCWKTRVTFLRWCLLVVKPMSSIP